MEGSRISGRQLRLLMVGPATVMGHLYLTPIVFGMAGRDGWLCIPVVLVPALILALVLARLGWLMPGRSLLEMYCVLLGKPLGKAVGLAHTGFFLLVPVITLRGLMDFMASSFMPVTPPVVLGAAFIIVCAYAVSTGLEGLARVNALLLPVLIVAGLMASGFTFPAKEYRYLLPVLEEGIGPVLRGCIPLLGLLAEMVVIGVVQPAVKQPATFGKNNVGAVPLICLLFLGPLTGPVAIFGEKDADELTYPTFSQIQYTVVGDLSVRLQGIAVLLWLFGSFGRVSLYYYASALSASRLLGLADYRKLVVPVGTTILILSIILFPDILVIKNFLASTYAYISIVLGMLMPAGLLSAVAARSFFRDRLR